MQISPRTEVPGTGLSALALLPIVAISTIWFVFWDGALWEAPRQSSHVGRFLTSYLVVMPLTAAALWTLGRLALSPWVASTAFCWAVKLIATFGLYEVLAPGAAYPLQASIPAVAGSSVASRAPVEGAGGKVHFRLSTGTPGAIVLENTRSSRTTPAATPNQLLVLRRGSFDPPLALVSVDDPVSVKSEDSEFHTIHVRSDGRTFFNQPITKPNAASALTLTSEGVYEVGCDAHPEERALLVVVEHALAALTDAQGNANFLEAPTGTLCARGYALSNGALHHGLWCGSVSETLTSATLKLSVPFASPQTFTTHEGAF